MSESTQPQAQLRARSLRFEIDGATILGPIDFELDQGEFLGVIGPNGAGKSTLLRLMAGLRRPTSGEIALQGRPLHTLAIDERASALAYVPQRAELGFPLTVLDVVLLGRLRGGGLFYDRAEHAQRGMNALSRVDLASFARREADTLSGGEFQRLQIARALMQECPIVLLDEPTSALDLHHQSQIGTILVDEHRRGRTLVAVLHDLNLAARLCSRLMLLENGRLAQIGTPKEVLTSATLDRVYGPNLARIEHPESEVPILLPRL
ncbi:MAG: ABC transporter ATP-binding protein [Myxococcales bacterium]|nr:ABC transporter ATP-binding protein [Myxococcales bacterium]